KQYKTPFIIAANKIDKISGWNSKKESTFMESYNHQPPRLRQELDMKIYELIGQLYNLGVSAELYTRITDLTKTVSIIPISARIGEGVPDLLTMLCGLTQKYLEKNLHIDDKGVGKGTILEVKEVKGLGTTIDVILYDGLVKKGDTIVIGHPSGAITTKARAILKTNPMKEIRVEKQFINFNEISAASGLKIAAPELENVISGVPLRCIRDASSAADAIKQVQSEIDEVQIKTDDIGVIIKADALGSLEALVKTFQDMQIPIKRAEIGTVNKKDVMSLEEVEQNHKVIFEFNTKILPDAEEMARKTKTSIFSSNIIYRLIEDYEKHIEEVASLKEKEILSSVTQPVKVRFISGFIFRQSKPAIVGMEVLGGKLKTGVRLMNDEGKIIATVHAIQNKGENTTEGNLGEQVAVSLDGAIVGRNIKEEDILYGFILKDDYKILSENLSMLNANEKNTLEEIREIMVKKDRMWDVF
ncbi:MAG: translation initiation factor IF-2, partial [Candidatus Aenigmarchaeota archaeon]|nr:translation initiation factor IF-2 [Candidatus Aenigmarchaeota archaeon]